MFGTIVSGFEVALTALFIYVLLYALISRICSCIEHCATARAIGKLNEIGLNIKSEDVEKYINGETSKNS